MKKKILSIITVLAMVFSLAVIPQGPVTAANYYDTEDLDCELAADVLGALGIMNGYTDGSFQPYNTITKAELAAIAVKLAGVDVSNFTVPSSEGAQFNDMAGYDGWAAAVIQIAHGMGIAKGDADGNFNPDMSATYEDAMQMIVCALGYDGQALSRGGDMDDYVFVARKLGIAKKAGCGQGQNISRGGVANVVYAALTVDLMQEISYSGNGAVVKKQAVEGENALNTYFDVEEVKGIVQETEYAAIDGDSTVDEGEVYINREVFDAGGTNISDYLGYYVEAYALENDNMSDKRIIIAFSVKNVKNNTVTIKDENLEDVTKSVNGYTFEYWADKDNDTKSKKVKTSATPRVMYNGKAVTDVTTALLKPEFGEIVLIDNNGDDKYDIVDIWEYELVYVFSASQTTGNVSNYYDISKTLKLDPNDDEYHVTFLNSNGGAASLGDIKQYSILYVYQSLDGEEKKVVISNSMITGDVTEVTEDAITVNGNEYEISPSVKSRFDFSPSDSGDFYLDADNRIAAFEGTAVIKKNIGMFIAINDGGLKSGYQVKVLTQNSGVRIFNLASTVEVNDVKMSSSKFYELTFTNALFGKLEGANYGSIVRPNPARSGFLYKLNSKDEICEVIVVGEGDGYLQTREIGKNGYLYYSKNYHVLHYSGETTTDEYGNSVGMRTYIDDKTINFVMDEAASQKDDNANFYTKMMNTYWDNFNFRATENFDFTYAYYYSPDKEPVNMQKTVCNFLVMADWYDSSADESDSDPDRLMDAQWGGDNRMMKFIQKIVPAYDKASKEETYRVYYFDGTSLKNNLIRPMDAMGPRAHVQHIKNNTSNPIYPQGYPVLIALDGSYIEDIWPYFDGGSGYTDMTEQVKPIKNESTDTMVMQWSPFYHEFWRRWVNDGNYSNYNTRMYMGMITSVDEVVGNKIFDIAYANNKTPQTTSNITIRSAERLEGDVFWVNYDRDGMIESIKKGTLADVAPGQLVWVRTRAYDTSPKWAALTGYRVHEIIILADSVEDLDYLHSNESKYPMGKFYDLVNKKVEEVTANSK